MNEEMKKYARIVLKANAPGNDAKEVYEQNKEFVNKYFISFELFEIMAVGLRDSTVHDLFDIVRDDKGEE